MIAPVQNDLNLNNFSNKGHTNKHLLIQIAECYQKLKIKNKIFYDYC